ncbi:MAG TPA: TonB-dependent receptor [Woeseiaceae bacterium]|nr:TonB-dependent receptor [Woeseiaceae bacterium]
MALGIALFAHDLPAQPAATERPEEIVVSVTPLAGAGGLPLDKIAHNVQSALAEDLERMQSLHLGDFLNRTMASVSLNAAQNNPLQPDVRYRGFAASPLLGLAQGLAVYQNGVRINEPFGDTVNWDLLPESAVHGLHLVGGSNPLFGLNTLGGALVVKMKNGFNAPGHHLDLEAGSFGRAIVSAQSGASRNGFAWFGSIQSFDENGWRDASPSHAVTTYGSLGWQGERSSLNVNGQYGRSDLTGNGAAPVELLQADRDAIFTAPDITENDLYMASVDGSSELADGFTLSGTLFFRRNKTDSFNGDASEYSLCRLGGTDTLLEGLDADALESLGLASEDICDDRFTDAQALESFLDDTALALGEDGDFRIEDLQDGISGTGVLSDSGINNVSTRVQESYGSNVQLSFTGDVFDRPARAIAGAAWFRGASDFDALVELATLDPVTRSTAGSGTGAFLDAAATSVSAVTETLSGFLTGTLDVDERLTVSLSGRFNTTRVSLDDRSGERPELEGRHAFRRLNPALGMTYQLDSRINLYASYSESSRTPTPVELACNEQVFERAAAIAAARGEDPEEVEFECRLPNAFLADPPLEQVVARSYEAGARFAFGEDGTLHAALFHTTSSNDIIFQTTGRATGLFANVEETRRMGIETGARGSWRGIEWFAAYSLIEATFEDAFDALSPNHPLADEATGAINVQAGDRIPGVPRHHLKLGVDYGLGDGFSIGFDVLHNSGQYLRGDESNYLEPTRAYAVANLRGRYRMNEHVAFFAIVENAFDADYETFGLLGEEPSEVDVPDFAALTDPRFLGPGAPRAAYVGIRLSL